MSDMSVQRCLTKMTQILAYFGINDNIFNDRTIQEVDLMLFILSLLVVPCSITASGNSY